jgi:hypothetical protein
LENARLQALSERLRGELTAVGSALGSLTGGRRGRGRGRTPALALSEAKPRRQRNPITDSEVLARRIAALVEAQAARRAAEEPGIERATRSFEEFAGLVVAAAEARDCWCSQIPER